MAAADLKVEKGTVTTQTTYVVKDIKMTFTSEDLADTTQIVLTKKELFELLTKKDESGAVDYSA